MFLYWNIAGYEKVTFSTKWLPSTAWELPPLNRVHRTMKRADGTCSCCSRIPGARGTLHVTRGTAAFTMICSIQLWARLVGLTSLILELTFHYGETFPFLKSLECELMAVYTHLLLWAKIWDLLMFVEGWMRKVCHPCQAPWPFLTYSQ